MRAFKTWRRCISVLALAVVATTPLFAQQQPAAPDESKPYLDKYKELLSLLQEAKFDYAGHQTRSIPSKGLVARWEDHGTVRVSAARKSFHHTYVPSRVHPDYEYLGTYEELVTPKRYLDISILNEKIAAATKQRFNIDTPLQDRADEWARRVGDRQLGILLGYVQLGRDDHSLLAVSALGPRELLSNQVVNARNLSGFSAKSDALEISTLFDPTNQHMLAEMQISRRGDQHQVKVGEATKMSLSILDIKFTDSKPSTIKLKITFECVGGEIEKPNHSNPVAQAEMIEIEPQTWDYDFELSNFDYEPQDAWFTLDHVIPNGTPVYVDGISHDLPLYWKDDKLIAFPMK